MFLEIMSNSDLTMVTITKYSCKWQWQAQAISATATPVVSMLFDRIVSRKLFIDAIRHDEWTSSAQIHKRCS